MLLNAQLVKEGKKKMSDEIVVEPLIANLSDGNPLVRAKARHLLIERGHSCVELLVAAMHTENRYQAIGAAEVLAEINDPRCFDVMKVAVLSPDLVLAQVAVEALERYGDKALSMLIEALFITHPIVQLQIVCVLERLRDRGAVIPLLKLLRLTDSSTLRYTIIQALGLLGDIQAVELIKSFENDPDHHVRKRVRIALERLTGSYVQTDDLPQPYGGA